MMFNRTTKQSISTNLSKVGNIPQQNSKNKKSPKLYSFKAFLSLSIMVALNFILVSTLFVQNEHRNAIAVDDGRLPLLLDGDTGDDVRKQIRGHSSSLSQRSSYLLKKEENRSKNRTRVEDEYKIAIESKTEKYLSQNFEDAGELPSSNGMAMAAETSSSMLSSSSSTSVIPYFLMGKTKYKSQKFHRRKTFQRIKDEEAKPIDGSQKVWVLPDPVKLPTRNHESILLEYETTEGNGGKSVEKQVLVNILGRHSRGVQWMDLETGEQRSIETNGTDPDRRPLNDLNHVASVVVDSLDRDINGRTRKEAWLPCGFHNDRVGNELSSNYVRIVDLETMMVRTGPRLPYSGGACGAAPIEAISGAPPLICAFGGTNGNHDTGTFLPYVSCYDRVVEEWVYPFGQLPVGMDHLSVVVIPRATCEKTDPARVLVFNFRTKNYSTHTSAEILAFDMPDNGWTREELQNASADDNGKWYTFANHSFDGGKDEAYAPRDASGVVMANDGKSVVNFGGINQVRNPLWKKKGDLSNGPKVFSTWYSTVRELNVCSKKWEKVADLGIQTFALMASASTKLNAAFFCGGSMYRQDFNGNTQLCLAIKIPGIKFWNHRKAAIENFPKDFRVGSFVTAPGSNETSIKAQ